MKAEPVGKKTLLAPSKVLDGQPGQTWSLIRIYILWRRRCNPCDLVKDKALFLENVIYVENSATSINMLKKGYFSYCQVEPAYSSLDFDNKLRLFVSLRN